MSDNLLKINIYSIILTTDIPNNKKYVLSTNQKDLEFPKLALTKNNISNINDSLIAYLKNYIYVSDIELLPQIININSELIEDSDSDSSTLNMVYGFIVNNTNSLNNCYWLEFDFLTPIPHSDIVFEVIQKLR